MTDSPRVTAYAADAAGCGHYRVIWPAQALRRQGHDVTAVPPKDRTLELRVSRDTDQVIGLNRDPSQEMDVLVLQRVTHPHVAQAVRFYREAGVAVVVDMDDDLNAIHPSNPAFAMMHPRQAAGPRQGQRRAHSWKYLAQACADATLVTVSTPALLSVYAPGGHGRVVPNYLPPMYSYLLHQDSETIGWPASLHSHPDDPSVTGGALARLVSEGARFVVGGNPAGAGRAFGLPGSLDPEGMGDVEIGNWGAAVARLGIGISPLADTRFNRSKSWLKPLEMSAAGVPWVGSPRAEYLRIHALGAGVLADTPRRWYKELARLRRSETTRSELAAAGREAVRDLTIEKQAWRWAEVFAEAVAVQRGGSSRLTPLRNGAVSMEPSEMSSSSSADRPSSATTAPTTVHSV